MGAGAVDGTTPYAPYYFNGGWVQPSMAPDAFHPWWTAPRKSVHDRISRPVRDRLGNGANRSLQKSANNSPRKEWRPKSPRAEIVESGKQQESNDNVDTLVVGTQVLKLKEPFVEKSLSPTMLWWLSSKFLWPMVMKLARARPNRGTQNTLSPSGVLLG